MLAHLKCAYNEHNSALQTTLVDRCQTPLLLNRWYADRYGVALTTVADDVLEYAAERPFDLVCTHSFLGRFDGESRRRLVARWHALLRPGGLVVTTQRIRPNTDAYRNAYADQDARDLSARVATAARAFHQPLTVDPDELAEAAYEFAIRKGGYVIRTNREITDVFEAQGFDIEQADDGTNDERSGDRPSSTAGKETYRMRVVARKR
jgi:SAM-dependent methyltransferase